MEKLKRKPTQEKCTAYVSFNSPKSLDRALEETKGSTIFKGFEINIEAAKASVQAAAHKKNSVGGNRGNRGKGGGSKEKRNRRGMKGNQNDSKNNSRNSNNDDTSASLLGMGKEEDWILHAMVIDKSQVRIPFSFYLFQRMGHYASNWRYVELIIDGDYRGLYILCEKIKRDDDRVDIAKLDDDDIYGDSLTGGYILRLDWLDYYSQGFSSNYYSQSGYFPLFYQWYYPKADDIQIEQENYISDWFYNFESAVFSSDYHNYLGNRYTDYINLNSFVDFLIINEFSKNSDGYKLSSYLHKDRDKNGGKLNAGPIWDFDQTYGVSLVCSNDDPSGWTYLQNQSDCEDLMSMPMWWQSMMQDTIFQNRLKCRWDDFRNTFLNQDSIFQWIKTDTTLISDAKFRNFTKWPHIGQQIWIEPSPIPQSYAEEIIALKSWIANRLDWLDLNIPGNCEYDITNIEEQINANLNISPQIILVIELHLYL